MDSVKGTCFIILGGIFSYLNYLGLNSNPPYPIISYIGSVSGLVAVICGIFLILYNGD